MRKTHGKNSLVVLGSINVPISLNNLFSYYERFSFVQKVFPDIEITGIPDYNNNKKWLEHLDKVLNGYGSSLNNVIFYVGNNKDAEFFIKAGTKIEVVDRYNGNSPKISATEVRKNLFKNKDITKMVNPILCGDIKHCFDLEKEFFTNSH